MWPVVFLVLLGYLGGCGESPELQLGVKKCKLGVFQCKEHEKDCDDKRGKGKPKCTQDEESIEFRPLNSSSESDQTAHFGVVRGEPKTLYFEVENSTADRVNEFSINLPDPSRLGKALEIVDSNCPYHGHTQEPQYLGAQQICQFGVRLTPMDHPDLAYGRINELEVAGEISVQGTFQAGKVRGYIDQRRSFDGKIIRVASSVSSTTTTASSSSSVSYTTAIASFEARKANGSTFSYSTSACADTTWVDSTVSARNGTLYNWSGCGASVGWNGAGSSSDPYYLAFNGGQYHVDVSLPYLTYSNSWTIEMVVKAGKTITIPTEATSGTGGTTGQNYTIYPYYYSATGITDFDAGNTKYHGVSVGTNGIAVCQHASGSLPCLLSYTGTIGTGWNHIVFVLDALTPKIYLNGVLVKTGLTSTAATIWMPNMIGDDHRASYGDLVGGISVVRFFSSVLSASEIYSRCDLERTYFGFSCSQ